MFVWQINPSALSGRSVPVPPLSSGCMRDVHALGLGLDALESAPCIALHVCMGNGEKHLGSAVGDFSSRAPRHLMRGFLVRKRTGA